MSLFQSYLHHFWYYLQILIDFFLNKSCSETVLLAIGFFRFNVIF